MMNDNDDFLESLKVLLQVKQKPSYPPRPSSQTHHSKTTKNHQTANDDSSEFDREESSGKQVTLTDSKPLTSTLTTGGING